MPGSTRNEVDYIDEKRIAMAEEQPEKSETVVDEDMRAMEKRIVRKLDMTLMPVVWVLYFFNYTDRNNIAYVINQIVPSGGSIS